MRADRRIVMNARIELYTYTGHYIMRMPNASPVALESGVFDHIHRFYSEFNFNWKRGRRRRLIGQIEYGYFLYIGRYNLRI